MQTSAYKFSLNGDWMAESMPNPTLADRYELSDSLRFTAHVPGSTLNDLILAGIAPKDIFWRDNAEAVQKYENYHWKYTKCFTLEEIRPYTELVFERLDTYCDIYLNGAHIAFCDNGYIEHRFGVEHQLKIGENTLEVYFYSPINYTLNKPPLEGAFTTERLYNRRVQCTYGWDWTMRFVTTGIPGECCLLSPASDMEIEALYIYTKYADTDAATVGVDVTLSAQSCDGLVTFCILSPDGSVARKYERYCREMDFRISMDIPKPSLWYPAGYGEQPLYTLCILYRDTEICRETFGIRTVQILQLEDEVGSDSYEKCMELKKTAFSEHYDKNEQFSGFILRVNGVNILCKGANWVPIHPFETEGMEEKILRILRLSRDVGINIIRVWGGGYIEKKCFYDECSRLGILVLQDFFMACGAYPEKEEWFIRQLSREAEYAARTLRNQPSLAWWHGDNENAVGGCDTDTDYRGRDSAYLGLEPVIRKLDPHRPFLPSSPYGGKTYASNTVGTTHNTQFMSFMFEYFDQCELTDYKEYLATMNARFVSEEPIFGASTRASLRSMMTDADIFGTDDAMWKYHTKTNPYLEKHLLDYYSIMAEKVFGAFENGADRLFKLQLVQCEQVRLSLERTGREKWFSSGVIYWMLADCWPTAAGWSIIDHDGIPKPAYYAFGHSGGDLGASVTRCANGELSLCVFNHTLHAKQIRYRYTVIQSNRIAEQGEWTALVVDANQKTAAACPALAENALLYVEVSDGTRLVSTFYREGKLPVRRAAEDAITVKRVGNSFTVTAHTYLQAVALESDDCHAVWSDNYFSMLPGETRTVTSSVNAPAEVIAYTLSN